MRTTKKPDLSTSVPAQQTADETLRGVLNSPLSSNWQHTIAVYAQEKARSPDGYLLSGGEDWRRVFEAVHLCIEHHLYAPDDLVEQEKLLQSLALIMRAFRYDEEQWRKEGKVRFAESMHLRPATKYAPCPMAVALYILS